MKIAAVVSKGRRAGWAAAAVVALGCGDGSSGPNDAGPDDTGPAPTATGDDAPVDITDALFTRRDASCAAYADEYSSQVDDVQRGRSFSGALTITVSDGTCVFETKAIPNHDFNIDGNFATVVSAQSDLYEMTTTPEMAGSPTPLILGDDAIFLNGVKLDLLAAACYGVGREPRGREKIGCGQDQIDNPWRYDPMSPRNEFGTDRNNAHTQPDGTYHYHGNPMAMFATDCASQQSPSPVIGFAADGFPIFGSCIEVDGQIRGVTSSYVLKDGGGPRQAVDGYATPVDGEGTIASSSYDGQFRGDYVYSPGAGDLDECNGRSVDGRYGYYVTDAYPWVLGCFRGTPDATFYRLRP
jgi:hypothetical protein